MRSLEILAVGLVAGLVASLVLNAVVLLEIRRLRSSYHELAGSWRETLDQVLVQLKHIIHSKPLTGTIYIWAQADSLLIDPMTDFHYTIVLINPSDSAVSTFMPYLTVTIARGDTVVYSRQIAFNMTGSITLEPHEERTIYHDAIMLAETVQKGIYCLQAVATEEGPPLFQTVPTLLMVA